MGREEVIKQECSDSNISKLKADMTFSGGFEYLEYTFIQIMENSNGYRTVHKYYQSFEKL